MLLWWLEVLKIAVDSYWFWHSVMRRLSRVGFLLLARWPSCCPANIVGGLKWTWAEMPTIDNQPQTWGEGLPHFYTGPPIPCPKLICIATILSISLACLHVCICRIIVQELILIGSNDSVTWSIWKMLGPFVTASRRTPHLPFTRCRYCRTPPLSHAAWASMSTTTATTTTTTTTRDRGPLWPHRMGPMI